MLGQSKTEITLRCDLKTRLVHRLQLLALACLVLSWPPSCSQAQSASQPDSPKLASLVQQAQSLIGQQKFSEAEKVLRKGTQQFAQRPGPWYLLGYVLHAQKKYDEALAMYAKSKSFPRTKTLSHYNIACIHSLQNNPELAFEALDAAIQSGFKNFGQLQGDSDFDNIKQDPRFAKLLPRWLSDDKIFVEPTRIIHQWSGENANDQFGWTARRVNDLDGDGKTDMIATAPTFNSGAGKIYVYSGASGKLIHSVTGKPNQRLGNSAVGLGDVNGDHIPDFIAGAPQANGKGAAFVYSGADASVLHALTGTTPGGQFGYEVSEAGDLDGDQVPDFFVGEMAGNGDQPGAGRAIAYSGKTGKQIFELGGERKGDGFGNAASFAELGSHEFLLAIGAQNAGVGNRGQVYVYHIKKGKPKLRFKIKSDAQGSNLGQMFISFPGDIDQDGTPDVYASDFSDSTQSPGGGKVVIHSGATGKQLTAIYGKVAGEGLGTSPSDAGDVDNDGIGDLIIGAWQNNEASASGGKVYLYSLAGKGKLLRSWTCRQSGDTLGFDACGIGDVDGDGNVDFLLTSAWSNVKGPKTGRVFIIAGEPHDK